MSRLPTQGDVKWSDWQSGSVSMASWSMWTGDPVYGGGEVGEDGWGVLSLGGEEREEEGMMVLMGRILEFGL